MTDPVDLTNLRAMIDNDRALEQELIIEFFRAADASLATLAGSTDAQACQPWYHAAHALKGISLNLGALAFGEAAMRAQEKSDASREEKRLLLSDLNAKYEVLKRFFHYPTQGN
jgi:hypothetical protein